MAPVRAPRRGVARLAAALVAGPLVVGAAVGQEAAATRVPLTSGPLLGQSYRTGAILDTFSRPGGTSLATTTDACGSPWSVTGGTLTVTFGGALRSSTSALVTATVPLCDISRVDVESGGDVRPNGGAVRAGVLVHAATGGRPATAAVYDGSGTGTVLLQRISSGGALTTWASVSNIGTSSITRHLRVTYLGGVYSVSVNGTVVLSHTIPDAPTRTSVEANRAVGVAFLTDTVSLFDNFQAFPR